MTPAETPVGILESLPACALAELMCMDTACEFKKKCCKKYKRGKRCKSCPKG